MVSSSRGLNAELLCILRVQSLPASELHRLGTNDAADGGSAEQMIQNIEAKVPPGSTHRDEAAIDVGPQRQARATTYGFELPPHIEATPVVLEHLGSVGSRHGCFGDVRRWCSDRGELHPGSNRPQAPVGVEGRPLTQLRRVGKGLPDFFRRVTQLSDENERPLLSVLSYLRPAGRTRCVLLAMVVSSEWWKRCSASASGVSTLRDLPRRSARHVFPSIHPSIHPSILRSLTAPLRSSPKSSSITASLLGRLDCVLVRRRNSPLMRSRALVVRSAFHCDFGKCVKVKSSSPASSKLAITGGHRSFHFRENVARALSTVASSSP